MWAWHFKANTLARASTHEATEKTQVFLDRCRCRTLASILYEYEGWGTLISKACIRFECLHVRFNPFFMSPFFKSPLLRAFLSRNVSTIGFARFRSISCKRNSDQQTKDCVFSAKRIRVNKASGYVTWLRMSAVKKKQVSAAVSLLVCVCTGKHVKLYTGL